MTENLIGAQYDVTKKSKLTKFYEKNNNQSSKNYRAKF